MTAIEFENISKQYRLGLVSTQTLSHDLRRFWITNVLGKENPYLKIGETNDRATKGTSDYVWALRDINFKVEQGDVVGIIGKNGAGKSTLLKLLSRVTGPTTGTIRAHGRIGSLLEVGTGFHGEMTGRENIFMNGAILGMTRQEIQSKLDAIIDFSGCERYIDTPVKRYSSGMVVRLGFAVAAFLEPEILVVDEVLAVGDAEFQKKAIGKMKDVSHNDGRTVLFVSHNMTSVKNLCKTGVLLHNGSLKALGDVSEIIDLYMEESRPIIGYDLTNLEEYEGNRTIHVGKVEVHSEGQDNGYVLYNKPVKIAVEILNPNHYKGNVEVAGVIKNTDRTYINYFGSRLKKTEIKLNGEDHLLVEVRFDSFPFTPGVYMLGIELLLDKNLAFWKDTVVKFYIEGVDFYESGDEWHKGIILLNQEWSVCENE